MNPPQSRDDLLSMQQDAIRRVREMQQRASRTLEQSNHMMRGAPPSPRESPPSSGASPEGGRHSGGHDQRKSGGSRPSSEEQSRRRTDERRPSSPHPPECPDEPPRCPLSKSAVPCVRSEKRGGLMGMLDGLGLEDDTILLLLLLYVLWKSDGDYPLLMALAYVLL